MREIYKNLWIGSQEDYESDDFSGFKVVQACKEPYHRQAVGYTGRGCPKDSPEYLHAVRGNRLILNLIDGDDASFISKEMINKAIKFIDTSLKDGYKVLVHCNKGESRSACIGMLYLHRVGVLNEDIFELSEKDYVKIYPDYCPRKGIRDYCLINWHDYNIHSNSHW